MRISGETKWKRLVIELDEKEAEEFDYWFSNRETLNVDSLLHPNMWHNGRVLALNISKVCRGDFVTWKQMQSL